MDEFAAKGILKRLQPIVAAAGVILSLLFVGLEVRENTKAVRGATIQAISDISIETILDGAGDADWVRILTLLRDGVRLQDLAPEDQMRYDMRASVTVRMMENRWRQTKLGILDDSGLTIGTGVQNHAWYRSESFVTFWRERNIASLYDEEFVEFMETEVMGIR